MQLQTFTTQILSCVQRSEPHYPPGPEFAQSHPVFFGCLDWHSAVHGHWLLAHALNEHSGALDPRLRIRVREVLVVLQNHHHPGASR